MLDIQILLIPCTRSAAIAFAVDKLFRFISTPDSSLGRPASAGRPFHRRVTPSPVWRWLARRPDPDDRRARIVQLTDNGSVALRAARADIRTMEAQFLKAIPRDQRAPLLANLADLARGRSD